MQCNWKCIKNIQSISLCYLVVNIIYHWEQTDSRRTISHTRYLLVTEFLLLKYTFHGSYFYNNSITIISVRRENVACEQKQRECYWAHDLSIYQPDSMRSHSRVHKPDFETSFSVNLWRRLEPHIHRINVSYAVEEILASIPRGLG